MATTEDKIDFVHKKFCGGGGGGGGEFKVRTNLECHFI